MQALGAFFINYCNNYVKCECGLRPFTGREELAFDVSGLCAEGRAVWYSSDSATRKGSEIDYYRLK